MYVSPLQLRLFFSSSSVSAHFSMVYGVYQVINQSGSKSSDGDQGSRIFALHILVVTTSSRIMVYIACETCYKPIDRCNVKLDFRCVAQNLLVHPLSRNLPHFTQRTLCGMLCLFS